MNLETQENVNTMSTPHQMADSGGIPVTIEFSGGLEMLFSNERRHNINLPDKDESGSPSDIKFLIKYLCKNVMKSSKKDLFVLPDYAIVPGIIVLINDADWELEGESSYVVQKNDHITFLSTLHGG